MNINYEDFIDYENKTLAEFHAAISNLEREIFNYIKKGDLISAYKTEKIRIKLETLLTKKAAHGRKHGYN